MTKHAHQARSRIERIDVDLGGTAVLEGGVHLDRVLPTWRAKIAGIPSSAGIFVRLANLPRRSRIARALWGRAGAVVIESGIAHSIDKCTHVNSSNVKFGFGIGSAGGVRLARYLHGHRSAEL